MDNGFKKRRISIEKEVLENRNFEEKENVEIDVVSGRKKLFNNRFNDLKVKYKKDKKKLLLLVSSILLVFSLMMGTSYAYLTYISKTEATTMIEAGTLALTLKNEANVINLNYAIPQKDSDALSKNSEYEFTIENTGNINANYKIKLENTCSVNKTYEIEEEEVKPDKCIPNEYIKVGIKQENKEYKVLEYDEEKGEYILETGTLVPSETSEYKMKVWLSYDTPNDYNTKGTQNIIYSGKLSIDYEQVAEDEAGVPYKVRYNANGGQGTMEDQSFAVAEKKKLTKNTFTKEGYTFIGWSTNKDSNTVMYSDEEKVSRLTDKKDEIVILYAVWSQKAQTIKVTVNKDTETKFEKEVNYGGNVEFALGDSEGYNSPEVTCTNEQTGSISNNKLTITNVTSNATCTVTYKANTYKIAYTLNGGTAGSSKPTSGTYGETVTISNPTREGYTFEGWTSTTINTGTAYYGETAWTNGSTKVKSTTFKNLTSTNNGTVTLVANWKANTYKIAYTLNGGTSGSSKPTSGT